MISALRQKSKFKFQTLKKKSNFWGFHGVVLVKTFPLMYQLLCRTDIDEAMMISFLGVRTERRTDRQGFGIFIWKHVGTQKISTQSSKLVVSRRSLYASPEVGDA